MIDYGRIGENPGKAVTDCSISLILQIERTPVPANLKIMRDSNKEMVEICGSEKESDLCFSIIKLTWAGESFTLKFAISEQDFFHIRNIITFRPFENTTAGTYRYFFSGSYIKNEPTVGMAKISVRVEQNKMAKQHCFPISNAYVANLLWFPQITEMSTLEKFMLPK